MHDLIQIIKQNELAEVQKSQARARALNSTESHPKKSSSCKRCGNTRRVLKVPTHPKAPITTEKCPAC